MNFKLTTGKVDDRVPVGDLVKHLTGKVYGDKGDLLLPYANYGYRFIFWGDEIEAIYHINPTSGWKKYASIKV